MTTPPNPPEPPAPPTSVWPRTLLFALLAFLLGLASVGGGVGQARFLWSAYHHGGL